MRYGPGGLPHNVTWWDAATKQAHEEALSHNQNRRQVSYTKKDVRDLAKLRTRLFNMDSHLNLAMYDFANLDIDTGRVAEALGSMASVRDGLRRANNLITDEHDRIAAIVAKEL